MKGYVRKNYRVAERHLNVLFQPVLEIPDAEAFRKTEELEDVLYGPMTPRFPMALHGV